MLVLPVDDMAAAKAFYCGILGCAEEREISSAGMVQLRAGASLIDLVDTPHPPGPWEDAEMRNRLAGKGVKIVEGIRYGAQGNGLSFHLKDPFGNVVELKGPSQASDPKE